MFAICCNYSGDKHVKPGALCWLAFTNGQGERYRFTVRSRGGRLISRYMRLDRLSGWRVKWVPEHLRERVWCFDDRQRATDEMARYCGPVV